VTPGTVGVGGAFGGCGSGGCGTDGVVTDGVVTGGTVTVGMVRDGTVIGGGGSGGRPAAADAVHPASDAAIIKATWTGRRRRKDLTTKTTPEGPPEIRPLDTRSLLSDEQAVPKTDAAKRRNLRLARENGGGEIRTHGPLAEPTVFKTAPFDRSGTPPDDRS
jgi:hypothetical protein